MTMARKKPAPTTEESASALGVTSSLVAALEEQFPEAFAPEIINGSDVEEAAENVMLDVAFTPVIPVRDSMVPCAAVELDQGGKYRVFPPANLAAADGHAPQDVTASVLRVMRARYILTRNYLQWNFDTLPPNVQRAALQMFFDGKPPWTPVAGSRMANIPTSGLSIPLKPGQTHADLIAEMFAEAGAGPGDVRIVVLHGDQDRNEVAQRLGFPVPDAELHAARARLLGVLAAAPAPHTEPVQPGPKTKPAGRPSKNKTPKDTLPIAEAFYSVVQLPPTTAPSPNAAMNSSAGMLRAVFAVWYTSHKPELKTLEPPDELGCFVGAMCAVEAQTAADRLIRQRKGPRSFAWPLHEMYAQVVYRDGLLQRMTTQTQNGRTAMTDLGLRHDDSKLTDTDVQAAYRKLVKDRRAHPDQGGTGEEFERLTLARDLALEYVRAVGEAHGRSGQSNEEKKAGSTLGAKGRAFLLSWAESQRHKADNMAIPANKTQAAIIRVLVKRGFARLVIDNMYALTPEGMLAAAEYDTKSPKSEGA
jgi:hypothetical protein